MPTGKIQIGRLDKRVLIQSFVPGTINEYGEDTPGTWSDIATVWAEVSYKSPQEKYEADQKVAYANVEITIRYRAGLKETDRIVYNGEIYGIIGFEYPARKSKILIRAYKRDNENFK